MNIANDLNHDFDQLIGDIQSSLKEQGTNVEAFSPTRRFHLLPEDRQQAVIKKLKNEKIQMDLLREDLTEIDKLEALCQFHGFYLKDKTIAAMLKHDEPWEIMDFQFQQIYRSKKVLELSNYSLEDYETYNSVELFNRPAFVLQEIFALTQELIRSKSTLFVDSIEPYIIEENLTTHREKMEIHHQFIAPLFNSTTDECVAMITAFKIKKIDPSLQKSLLLFS